MSTPTNEQREADEAKLSRLLFASTQLAFECGDFREGFDEGHFETLYEKSLAADAALKSWALSRIEELAKRLDAVREGNVWHGANGGFFSARTGDSYNTLDQALDAELWSASSSGANTP